MQTPFRYIFMTFGAALTLVIAGPQQGMAQRFNHGNFGGGRPMAAPAQRPMNPPAQRPMNPPAQRPMAAPVQRPAPAQRPIAAPVQRPAQVSRPAPDFRPESAQSRQPDNRPAEPRSFEERPTINGGARNFGNHDFGRPAEPRPDVRVRDNITVRDRVNVYHTGGDRGIHPYYYHPYRPYYWGPHWHPLGFFLGALAADAIWLDVNNRRYYYDDGCFYLPENGGYDVVAAPIGAIVASLPPGYETPEVDGVDYFYFGGVFYVYTGQGYQVVTAPPGAVIYQLPTGAVDEQIDGQDILVYNNTFYQPISQDGQDAYEVIPPPGQ